MKMFSNRMNAMFFVCSLLLIGVCLKGSVVADSNTAAASVFSTPSVASVEVDVNNGNDFSSTQATIIEFRHGVVVEITPEMRAAYRAAFNPSSEQQQESSFMVKSTPSDPHHVTVTTTLSSGQSVELKFPKSTSSSSSTSQSSFTTFDAASSSSQTQFRQYIVSVRPPVTAALRAELNQLLSPYQLQSYFPDNKYTFVSTPEAANNLFQSASVLDVVEMIPQGKGDLQSIQQSWASDSITVNKTQGLGPLDYQRLFRVQVAQPKFNPSSSQTSKLQVDTTQSTAWAQQVIVDFQKSGFNGFSSKLAVSDQNAQSQMSADADQMMILAPNAIAVQLSNTTDPSQLFQQMTQHPLVESIEALPTYRTFNVMARGMVQSHNTAFTPLYTVSGNLHPALDGTGQVVSVSDTGIDFDHCMFADPAKAVPVNAVDMTHRKIVTYSCADKTQVGDDKVGHGTHVDGSVAGFAVSTTATQQTVDALNQYRGMAYGAKLAFYDLSTASGGLNVPNNDPGKAIYGPFYAAPVSSRIGSASWGASFQPYNSDSLSFDQFLYNNPDHLIFVAASNDGYSNPDGTDSNTPVRQSIGQPGGAKNIVSVGAALNQPTTDSLFIGTKGAQIAEASFGPSFSLLPPQQNRKVQLAQPLDSCTALTAKVDPTAAVVVQRGTCDFVTKVQNAQNAGATLVLLVDNTANGQVPIGASATAGTTNGITVTTIGISTVDGAPLIAGTATTISYPGPPPAQVLAFFSSRGPMADGRIKPDILSPGETVYSAMSDASLTTPTAQTCMATIGQEGGAIGGIQEMSGTSMATPVTAGSTALLRQYLVDGYYQHPQGYADVIQPTTPAQAKANPMNPSGALLKAMLIQSGSFTGSYDSQGAKAVPAPSYDVGFGEIQLNRVIKFADTQAVETQHRVLALDGGAVATSQEQTVCVAVDSTANTQNEPLRATLVWTDPVGSLNAPKQLVNNLDLLVDFIPPQQTTPTNTFIGNNGFDGQTPANKPDTSNNAEQVTVTQPASGFYKVRVTGTAVNVNTPQKYALVVSGVYRIGTKGACPDAVSCPVVNGQTCAGHGTCATAQQGAFAAKQCVCQRPYTGTDCSQQATALTTQAATYSIQPGQMAYFYYQASGSETDLKFAGKQLAAGGDADYYLLTPKSLASYPTTTTYDLKDIGPDTASPPPAQQGVTVTQDGEHQITSPLVQGFTTVQAGIYMFGVQAASSTAISVQLRAIPAQAPSQQTQPTSPPASSTQPTSPPASSTQPTSPPASSTQPTSPPASSTQPTTGSSSGSSSNTGSTTGSTTSTSQQTGTQTAQSTSDSTGVQLSALQVQVAFLASLNTAPFNSQEQFRQQFMSDFSQALGLPTGDHRRIQLADGPQPTPEITVSTATAENGSSGRLIAAFWLLPYQSSNPIDTSSISQDQLKQNLLSGFSDPQVATQWLTIGPVIAAVDTSSAASFNSQSVDQCTDASVSQNCAQFMALVASKMPSQGSIKTVTTIMNLLPIIGGVAAGVIVLTIIIYCYCCRKRQNKDNTSADIPKQWSTAYQPTQLNNSATTQSSFMGLKRRSIQQQMTAQSLAPSMQYSLQHSNQLPQFQQQHPMMRQQQMQAAKQRSMPMQASQQMRGGNRGYYYSNPTY